jgi:hypothetical protein
VPIEGQTHKCIRNKESIDSLVSIEGQASIERQASIELGV